MVSFSDYVPQLLIIKNSGKNFFLFTFSGNGYISTDTLKEILKELDNKLTNEDINNIIEEVDEDGSGTLDFDGNLKMPVNDVTMVNFLLKSPSMTSQLFIFS